MHCVTCQAQLAPGSTSCFFCGAAQPAPATSGSLSALQQHVGMAVQGASSESWRIWVSLFLGGLYAPVASDYLLKRERWGVPGGSTGVPPSPPSNRGMAVLGMFVGLPVLWVAVLGYVGTAADVAWGGPDGVSYGVSGAQSGARWNVPVAWFYLLSLVLSRRVEGELAILLHQVTGGSRAAAREFRPNRVGRALAYLLAAAPLVLILGSLTVMVAVGWDPRLEVVAGFYLVSVALAAWSTSWLHVSAIHRYRRAVLVGLP